MARTTTEQPSSNSSASVQITPLPRVNYGGRPVSVIATSGRISNSEGNICAAMLAVRPLDWNNVSWSGVYKNVIPEPMGAPAP